MSGQHAHPYTIQDAAFFFSLIPSILLLGLMLGARFFDGARRARKPSPARAPGIAARAPQRRLLPTPD